jgi:hypothetical protein
LPVKFDERIPFERGHDDRQVLRNSDRSAHVRRLPVRMNSSFRGLPWSRCE